MIIKYGDKTITSPINIEIKQGERVAIVGKNGSGKTSFIKVLLGQLQEFEGEFKVSSNLKISYVPQDTSALAGSIYQFCADYKIDKTKLFTILFKFGFERTQFEKTIDSFSDGQKKKLLIAKSLCEEANLYIWDEPLNYIDIISRKQIENLLLADNASMIFVEHDKFFCETIATKELIL